MGLRYNGNVNTTTLVLPFALDKLFTQKDSAVCANLRNQSVDGVCEDGSNYQWGGGGGDGGGGGGGGGHPR